MASTMGWTKKCRKCGRDRHTSAFGRQKTMPGQMPICISCASVAVRKKKEVEARRETYTTS